MDEHDALYTYRNLLKMPLNGEELRGLARMACATVKDMVNLKSQAYKKMQPDLAAMDEEDIIELINSQPRIMKRPVLSDGQHLVMGFSEDAFLSMLS